MPGSVVRDARGVSARRAVRLAGAVVAGRRACSRCRARWRARVPALAGAAAWEGRGYPVRNVRIYPYMTLVGTVVITKGFFLM